MVRGMLCENDQAHMRLQDSYWCLCLGLVIAGAQGANDPLMRPFVVMEAINRVLFTDLVRCGLPSSMC